MRRLAWFVLLVVVTAVGGMLILRKSETDRVRGDLIEIARALSFDAGTSRAPWDTALRDCLSSRVSDPVTVDLIPYGESSYTIPELVARATQTTHGLDEMTIRLNEVGINFDRDGQRATAKGEAVVELVEPTKLRRTEPRKFAATLERRTSGWVVVHARISEPRIDQPEARP